MSIYVIVAAIVTGLTHWAWFSMLFPQTLTEVAGGEEESKRLESRALVFLGIALIVFAVAMGTFVRNRGVLDTADAVKLAVKVWVGFILPASLVWWSRTRQSLTALVAASGAWLLVSVECAILAAWFLLK